MTYRFILPLLVLAACGGKDDPADTDASTGEQTTTPTTSETGELPPAAEVCAAACETFAECTASTPTCVSDCEAGIAFMAMNNPGTECAAHETGRMDCLAQLTCDELDAYLNKPDDPGRPCKLWIDLESEQCAIE